MLCARLLEHATDAEGLLEKVHKKARDILAGAGHMNRLIEDLLAMERLKDDRLELELAECAPAKLVEQALQLVTPQAEQKRLTLERSVAADLPHVRCDAHRLVQVLANLLGNAVKFTPEGGSIHAGVEPGGDALVFSVRDTGPGIPADSLVRIFERLWQVGPQRSVGTGLGLFIARGIVEAHGGRIWAESEPGEGSRFYFTLPCA